MLIENDEILLKNKKIADVFNSYFDSVTDSFDLFSWSTQIDNENADAVQNILKWSVKEVIERLPSNKATTGGILIKILKESEFTLKYLTSCVNEAISSVSSQILLNCQIQCLSSRRKIWLINVI